MTEQAPKITREEIEALLKLADAATPGPWTVCDYRKFDKPWVYVDASNGDSIAEMVFANGYEPMPGGENAAFIAAANPAAIIALLDELDALRAMLSEVKE